MRERGTSSPESRVLKELRYDGSNVASLFRSGKSLKDLVLQFLKRLIAENILAFSSGTRKERGTGVGGLLSQRLLLSPSTDETSPLYKVREKGLVTSRSGPDEEAERVRKSSAAGFSASEILLVVRRLGRMRPRRGQRPEFMRRTEEKGKIGKRIRVHGISSHL